MLSRLRMRPRAATLIPALVLIGLLAGSVPAGAAVTFAPPRNYATGGGEIWAMALADVDGDGRADVLAPNTSVTFDPPTFSVLTSRPNGTLRSARTVPVAGGDMVATRDLNGDGDIDVITSSVFSTSVDVLLNDGDGTFTAGQSVPVAGWALAIGDFNQDGRPDLLVAADAGRELQVFLGAGDGTFTQGVTHNIGDNSGVSGRHVHAACADRCRRRALRGRHG